MPTVSESSRNIVQRLRKNKLLLFIIILLIVLIRIRLLDIPLERDEGEYAYMGQLILQGIPPYSEAYNMKFPGTYLMYALIMALFGQTTQGIHIGLIVVNCSAILLVYLLARKMIDDLPAAVAAGTYGILSLSSSVQGFAAHATHFVVLPALAGTLLLLRALDKEKFLLYLLSGALLGTSVMMKQTGIFFFLFGGIYILWRYFCSKRSVISSERITHRPVYPYQLGAFFLGSLLPPLITALWLYAAGVFDRFWFWTVVYASKYSTLFSISDAPLRLKNSLFRVAGGFSLFWIVAALGVVVMFFDKRFKQPGNYKVFVLLFTLFSFLSICTGFYFRGHYFVTLLPAVSLLVGIFLQFLGSGRSAFVKIPSLKLVGLVIIIASATIGVIHQRYTFFYDEPDRISGLLYYGNPFSESREVARFIRERTNPDDRIAVLGSEPEIFFYANRRSATGYIYMYSLTEPHEYALAMQKEMAAEIEAAKPKFFVDVRVRASRSVWGEPETYIVGWAQDYIANKYNLVGVVDVIPPGVTVNGSVYKWYDDAKHYQTLSLWSLLIYERR